jgi:hypothetical protein
MILILLYSFSVAIGFISYYFAIGLDSMMDWGSIFGKFRYKKFLKYAITHKELITKSTLVHSMDANDGEAKVVTRANFMNALYWELVSWEPKFKLWVCVECMSVRLATYLNLLMILSIYLFLSNNLFIFLNIPFSFMVSISIIYFNIRNNG